jgi:hypothetical protein
MIFTLEALQAKHGDALLLHCGPPNAPKLIVIDGGPAGVYTRSLKKRLLQIKQSRSPNKPLPIELLMVSHIDDDHINGVLDLTDELLANQDNPPFTIKNIWHNSFEDVLGARAANLTPAAVSAAAAASASPAGLASSDFTEEATLVLASVPQGRRLRDNVNGLGITLNKWFNKDVVKAPKSGEKRVPIGDVEFLVLGPSEERVEALRKEWDLDAEKRAAKAAKGAEAAAFKDKSVFNLSSIVVLAKADGKTALLTGDARGDLVLEGLRNAGKLHDGPLHVDVFKIPHHGSIHNAAPELFQQVTADHYVISADGKHGNPDPALIEMLLKECGTERPFTVHVTNNVPAAVEALSKAPPNCAAKYRDAAADRGVADVVPHTIKLNLGTDELTF